jgi:hypothetical protein
MSAAKRLSDLKKKIVDNPAGCLIWSRRFAALKNRGLEIGANIISLITGQRGIAANDKGGM